MAQQAYPTLNGEAQSWADSDFKIACYNGPAADLLDLASADWDVALERGEQRSKGGDIKCYTHGQTTPGGKVSLYADGCVRLIEILMDVALAQGWVRNGNEAIYGMVPFDIIVHHTPLGSSGIRTVELLGCRFAGDAGTYAEGTDADKNEIPLSITRVVRVINGKRGVLL